MDAVKLLTEMALIRTEKLQILAEVRTYQLQVTQCFTRLGPIIQSSPFVYDINAVRGLRDEIFACRIQIQSLHVRIRSLNEQILLVIDGQIST